MQTQDMCNIVRYLLLRNFQWNKLIKNGQTLKLAVMAHNKNNQINFHLIDITCQTAFHIISSFLQSPYNTIICFLSPSFDILSELLFCCSEGSFLLFLLIVCIVLNASTPPPPPKPATFIFHCFSFRQQLQEIDNGKHSTRTTEKKLANKPLEVCFCIAIAISLNWKLQIHAIQ